MNAGTSADKPWRCNDCGTGQELVTHNGKSFYTSSGWYRVLIHPDGKPVYLDAACFDSYNEDWPDYAGTHETSVWQWGQYEGKGLWVLPADYFGRRDAYRRLPRWEERMDGYALVTHDGRTLGRVEKYRKFGKTLHRAYDERDRPMSGRLPLSLLYAKDMVEVHHKLDEPGAVQR